MTGLDPAATVAEAVVAALLDTGVEQVVVSPGSRNTPLVLALATRAGLIVDVVLDERAAAFFALGACRVSGRPVALFCTSGSALANYLPALTEAAASGLPLVVVSANRPQGLQASGAPQTMAQPGSLEPHVRETLHIEASADAAAAPIVVHRRVARVVAAAVRPPLVGPVHIDVAFAKPLWVEEAPRPAALPRVDVPLPRLIHDDSTIDALASAIAAARAPIVLVGPRDGSAAAPVVTDAIVAFAAQTGIPVVAEPAAGLHGVLPGLLGHGGLWLEASGIEPDLIVRLGGWPSGAGAIRWLEASRATQLVLSDRDPAPDPQGSADWIVIGAPDDVLRRVADRVERRAHATLHEVAHAAAAACAQALDACATLTDLEVARLAWSRTDAPLALHLASSTPIRDVDEVAEPRTDAPRVFASRGVNGIDGTIATAAGEARATERGVRLLVGDLAFLHDLDGLGLLAQESLPVDVVVVDNGGGRIFERLPIAGHEAAFERFFLTPQRADPAMLARGFGLETLGVDSAAALSRALDAWSGVAPRVVVATTDPGVSRTLRAAVTTAVRLSIEERR